MRDFNRHRNTYKLLSSLVTWKLVVIQQWYYYGTKICMKLAYGKIWISKNASLWFSHIVLLLYNNYYGNIACSMLNRRPNQTDYGHCNVGSWNSRKMRMGVGTEAWTGICKITVIHWILYQWGSQNCTNLPTIIIKFFLSHKAYQIYNTYTK